MPVEVIVHVRGHAGVGEDVGAVHESQATAKSHRGLVRERLGVKYRAGEVRALAERAMRQAARKKDNPADLINEVLETLVKERLELPGYSTLDTAQFS